MKTIIALVILFLVSLRLSASDFKSLEAIKAEDIAAYSNNHIDKYEQKPEDASSVNICSKVDSRVIWVEN